jgi:hypothetical protein
MNAKVMGIPPDRYRHLHLELPPAQVAYREAVDKKTGKTYPFVEAAASEFHEPTEADKKVIAATVAELGDCVYVMQDPAAVHGQHRLISEAFLECIGEQLPMATVLFYSFVEEKRLPDDVILYLSDTTAQDIGKKITLTNESQDSRHHEEGYYGRISRAIRESVCKANPRTGYHCAESFKARKMFSESSLPK